MMDKALGDLYVHASKVLCPTTLGWPCVRKRVYGILILREIFGSGDIPRPRVFGSTWEAMTQRVQEDMEMFLEMFTRRREITFEDFMNATQDEINQEVTWMKSRPKSQGKDKIVGECQPFEFLTAYEQNNIDVYYQQLTKSGVTNPEAVAVQLNQNAKVWKMGFESDIADKRARTKQMKFIQTQLEPTENVLFIL